MVLRQLEVDDMTYDETKVSLHILINLSSHDLFNKHFLDINATIRLARLFLSKVDKEIKVKPLSEDNLFSLDLEFGLLGTDNVGFETKEDKSKPKSNTYQISKGNYILTYINTNIIYLFL